MEMSPYDLLAILPHSQQVRWVWVSVLENITGLGESGQEVTNSI